MIDIINLTKWEFFKIIKNKFSIYMILILTIGMFSITFNEYTDYKNYSESSSAQSYTKNWVEQEQFLLDQADELLSDPFYDEIQIEAIKRRLEIAKFKIETNTERSVYKNKWYFFSDNSFKWISILVVLFTAIIGAFNLSSEYSNKTINQLLLLPYKRYKILTAKYLATLLFGLLLFALVILLGSLSGLFIYGIKSSGGVIVLYGKNGPYALSMFVYSLIVTLLQIINIVFYVSLAFFIAVTLKSVSIAAIVTILSITLLQPFALFASRYYSILYFLPFNNLDFRKFLEFGSTMPNLENLFGSSIVVGFTPLVSATIIIVYLAFFIFFTFYSFCKKDVR